MCVKFLSAFLISVFALSNLALANSQGSNNGKPFSELLERINSHGERITDLESKVSSIQDNQAKLYVVKGFGQQSKISELWICDFSLV
jgi:hypothetical protein